MQYIKMKHNLNLIKQSFQHIFPHGNTRVTTRSYQLINSPRQIVSKKFIRLVSHRKHTMMRKSKEFPKVWSTFEKTTKSGVVKKFQIVDATDDMFDDVASLTINHFLNQEPFSLAAGILDNPEYLRQTLDCWRYKLFPLQLSLACVEQRDDCPSSRPIAGFTFLNLIIKGQKSKGYEECETILKLLDAAYSGIDIFEKFGVSQYLTACGTVVDPAYRGMNISVELFKAREPLCRDSGIEVCETIFSGPASQTLATKAGYETLVEIEYEDIEKKTDLKFPRWAKTMKIMTVKFT